MIRVSSDWTLFFRFFLPTVWIVFFGVIIGVVFFTMHIPSWKWIAGILGFYIAGILLLIFTLLSLKRVECSEDYFYITNYFKTYRYTYDSLHAIRTFDILLFKIIVLIFHEPSSFGRRIFFLARRNVWDEWKGRFDVTDEDLG